MNTAYGLIFERAFIDGEWVGAVDGSTFAVRNPANQSVICHVPDMKAEDAATAINAAARALPDWSALPAKKRARILRKWYELQLENADELAAILTLEQGKPLREAKGEVLYGASFVEWFSEEARRVYGDVIPGPSPDKRIVVIKQPVGVVAAITPWNFPNAMITRKIAPALAAGCTVVVKPAEDTPLSALALAALAEEAGVPAGVINIVTTSDPATVGSELSKSSVVRKLSFTGSTEVGKLLMRQSADTVKKISLELGGNAPFIVFDDADIEAAVDGAIQAKYRNAGQTCVCANRIYVQDSVYDSFVTQFADAVTKRLKVGNGMGANVTIGPLINEAALDKVVRLVDDAVLKGAKTIVGGEPLGNIEDGCFYAPTVLRDVDDSMLLHSEEIFGPVAPVYSFSSEREVIEKANNTKYGLAAYFYGNHMAPILRVAGALEFGMIGINTGAISTAEAPFGGVKESGTGREGSKYGIEEFVEVKYLCFGGIDADG